VFFSIGKFVPEWEIEMSMGDVPEPKLAFHFYGGFETSHFDTNWVFKLSLPSPKDDHGESGTL